MCYIGVLKTLHLALCTQNNGEQTDKVYIASHSYVYEQLNKDKEARIENAPSHTPGSAKGGICNCIVDASGCVV